jgi:drug/metabolite transporter (DMT)-like permease
MLVTTRAVGAASDKLLVTGPIVGAALAGLVAAPFAWIPPSGRDLVLMALLGIVSMAAYMCVNRALKLAPAATVAPYQYTLIVWAILFGYPFFGDVPTPHMLAGAAIIIAAGLFIFWREQKVKRLGPGG